jgi:hypothetical protein
VIRMWEVIVMDTGAMQVTSILCSIVTWSVSWYVIFLDPDQAWLTGHPMPLSLYAHIRNCSPWIVSTCQC